MTVNLSSAAEKILAEQLASGKFASAADVVERALQLFAEHQDEAESLANLRRSVQQMEAGQTLPADEAFAEIRRDNGWAE